MQVEREVECGSKMKLRALLMAAQRERALLAASLFGSDVVGRDFTAGWG